VIRTLLILLAGLNLVVLTYFLLLNTFYLLTTIFAFRALRNYNRRLKTLDVDDLIATAGAPPITLIAPAFNEEPTCVESARSLLALRYPEYEVIVVNDGSRDGTLARLTEAFDLTRAARLPTASLPTAAVRGVYRSGIHPNLWVIDKENGGKADALNAGLNYCRSPVFCGMDADSLLEPEALIRVIRPFLEDGTTVAAGGIIRIVNGCEVRFGQVIRVRLPDNLLARIQVLEYLRAFLTGRMGWSAMRAMLIISGAFGLFRRSVVVDAGGFATDTVGEDMELVVRLHSYCIQHGVPYRIPFVPDPVAWTECPESLRALGRQRDRWQRGLAQTLTRHRHMLLRARYGKVGLVAFPYFFFLEMFGPAIELGGYLAFALSGALGLVDWRVVLAFLTLAFIFGVMLSVASVTLEEMTFRRYENSVDLVRLFLLAIVENIGYRQLSMYWRVKGLVSAARGQQGWGVMQRKGFMTRSQRAAPLILLAGVGSEVVRALHL
jgi:cellulose synthase/poly-beta-1,6-N-acetylglucosamine synthase-like glycosyltransferase